MLEKLKRMMPWNRPRLSDLPLEERRRAKALMLGACAGPAMRTKAGILRVECEKTDSSAATG